MGEGSLCPAQRHQTKGTGTKRKVGAEMQACGAAGPRDLCPEKAQLFLYSKLLSNSAPTQRGHLFQLAQRIVRFCFRICIRHLVPNRGTDNVIGMQTLKLTTLLGLAFGKMEKKLVPL